MGGKVAWQQKDQLILPVNMDTAPQSRTGQEKTNFSPSPEWGALFYLIIKTGSEPGEYVYLWTLTGRL